MFLINTQKLEDYRKHKLKKSDTIESVAQELGITILELTGFHNIYCTNNDTIGYELPSHLEELYVYPHIREFKKKEHPKVHFTIGNTLVYKPNYKKFNYGVMYTIWSGDILNTIKQQTSVVCKQQTKEGFLFEIDRMSKTFVNDLECNLIADELAEKVAKVIYPLTILVSNEGRYIDIVNFEKIQKRWKITYAEILEEYEGDWVEKYLALSQQTLKYKNVFRQSLAKDWFLCSYFSGLFVNFSDKFVHKNSIFFPLLPNIGNLEFAITQKIDPYLEDKKFVNIEQNGILIDPRAKADFENGSNFPDIALQNPNAQKTTGDFNAKYVLDTKTHDIESVVLTCSIALDVPHKIQVTISKLNN